MRTCGRGRVRQQDAALLRGTWPATAAVGAVLLVVGWFVAGAGGLAGAGAGVAVVAAFFLAGMVAIGFGARISPTAMLAVALGTYVVKIGLLGALLVAMRDVTVLDGAVFGWSVLVSTLVWITAEVRTFSRQRIAYVEPRGDGR